MHRIRRGQAPHHDVAVTLADADGESLKGPRDGGQFEVRLVGFATVNLHAEPREVAEHQEQHRSLQGLLHPWSNARRSST